MTDKALTADGLTAGDPLAVIGDRDPKRAAFRDDRRVTDRR